MNRREEYEDLMQLLETPAEAVEDTLVRAKKRLSRRRCVTTPLTCVVMLFALFVASVNLCPPVAYAFSQVPVLKELTEAVSFSKSLTDAVENDYVQEMNLEQTNGDVTASIEYLIVDQKQVNVFYRINSEKYPKLGVQPELEKKDKIGYHAWTNYADAQKGDLQSVTFEFEDAEVPDNLQLKLMVYDLGEDAEAEDKESGSREDSDSTGYVSETEFGSGKVNRPDKDIDLRIEYEATQFDQYGNEVSQTSYGVQERNYVAEFDFSMEFDPTFTAACKVIPIDQTVSLDGQTITFTEVEVYPTHVRVKVEDATENTAWLRSLDFYIETDWGMKFEAPSNGVTANGKGDYTPAMAIFRTDSTYFYEAKKLKLVVTGAEWLRKDMEKVYVNLVTGETGELPEGVTIAKTERVGNDWIVQMRGEVRKEKRQQQLFLENYYDAEGKKYLMTSWSSTFEEKDENGKESSFVATYPLKDYTFDEVWLSPCFSHTWEAAEPVEIEVQ